MRVADNCGLGDFGMRNKSRFDFRCSHPVTGHVQYIIDPACNPIIAIFVSPRSVTAEIAARESCKISFYKAFMITIDGAHLSGP